MNNNRKIRVAITHGDTNGIGYELIFKAFENPEIFDLCTPIVYGSPKIAAYHHNALDSDTKFSIISDAREAQDGRLNLLTVFDDDVKVEIGTPTEESGEAGLRAIDRAIADYREGLFDVLVTAPIDNNDAFHFSGQSRYIEDHIECDGQGLSILASEELRVALQTRNLPLKQVAESITKDGIKATVKKFYDSLRRDFRIANPRIAILSLNPKAGDNGLLGTEEQDIIRPAIDELVSKGKQAFGPYPAGDFFGSDNYLAFDGILAMYHDQGTIPFRALSSSDSIVCVAGLPVPCTMPLNTTCHTNAGKGVTDENSFRQAVYMAIDICRNRRNYDAPLANPLPKLFHERRDDGEKVRFAVPK